MTNTKRSLRILLISSLFAFTIACKKDNADSVNLASSTVTFKVDGVEKTFSNCIAVETTIDSSYALALSASSGTDNSIAVAVSSEAPITAGFKLTETYAAGTDDLLGLIAYGKDSVGYSNINIEDKTKQQIEIHITEKTSTFVKGTFSGKLYSDDEVDTKAYLLTEGKFNALLVQQ